MGASGTAAIYTALSTGMLEPQTRQTAQAFRLFFVVTWTGVGKSVRTISFFFVRPRLPEMWVGDRSHKTPGSPPPPKKKIKKSKPKNKWISATLKNYPPKIRTFLVP